MRGMVETAVATGFGFVLALLWYDFLRAALTVAGISVSGTADLAGLLILGLTLLLLTGVLLLVFVVVARWTMRTGLFGHL